MMRKELQQIRNAIASYIDISEEEWNDYSKKLTVKSFQRNELILRSGEICKNVFFVNSGTLRVFFADSNGYEQTFHFAIENTFVTDYESFLNKTKSTYSVQALENSETVVMSYDMLHEGYTNLKNGEKLGRKLAEEYFFLFSNKIKSLYTQAPLLRYQNMNKLFPGILQRVPQHYIASYLNITPVHLSRLKSN